MSRKRLKVDGDDDLDEELLAITGGDSGVTPAKKRFKETEKHGGEEEEEEEEEDAVIDKWDRDCIGDEQDRRWLSTLPEFEREQEIADRFERRQRQQERREIKRRALERKRKAEQKQVRSSRGKSTAAQTKEDALADMRRKAKEAKERRTRRESYGDSSNESDRSYDDDEDEWDDTSFTGRRHGREDMDSYSDDDDDSAQPISLDEISELQLARDLLERWYREDWFKEKVIGFFVRVGLGMTAGKRVYRLAQIVGVGEGTRKYTCHGEETWMTLTLRHGDNKKDFRLEVVSNQRITHSEYAKWQENMKATKLSMPTRGFYRDKIVQLEWMHNARKEDTEIKRQIERNIRMGKARLNPAQEKAKIMSNLEVETDEEKRQELLQQLKKWENLTERKRMEVNAHSQRVNAINKRAQRTNVDTTLNRKSKRQDGEPGDFSVFSRRPTQPILMIMGDDEDTLKEEEDRKHREQERLERLKAEEEAKKRKKRTDHFLNLSTAPEDDEGFDMSKAFEATLEIDIDVKETLDVPRRPRARPMVNASSQVTSGKVRTLSLFEWQQRRGLVE